MEKKYLKYKAKYLELKKILQDGGRRISIKIDSIIREYLKKFDIPITNDQITFQDTDEMATTMLYIIKNSPNTWRIKLQGFPDLINKETFAWRLGSNFIISDVSSDTTNAFATKGSPPKPTQKKEIGGIHTLHTDKSMSPSSLPPLPPSLSSLSTSQSSQQEIVDVNLDEYVILEELPLSGDPVPERFALDTHYTEATCYGTSIRCVLDTGNSADTLISRRGIAKINERRPKHMHIRPIAKRATKENILMFNMLMSIIIEASSRGNQQEEALKSRCIGYKIKPIIHVFERKIPSGVATFESTAADEIDEAEKREYEPTQLSVIVDIIQREGMLMLQIPELLPHVEGKDKINPLTTEYPLDSLYRLCDIRIPTGIGRGEIELEEINIPVLIETEDRSLPPLKLLFKASVGDLQFVDLLVSRTDIRKLRRLGIKLDDTERSSDRASIIEELEKTN